MAPGLAVAAGFCGSVDGLASGAPVAFSAASVFPLPSARSAIILIFCNVSGYSPATCCSVYSQERTATCILTRLCEYPLNMKYCTSHIYLPLNRHVTYCFKYSLNLLYSANNWKFSYKTFSVMLHKLKSSPAMYFGFTV